MVCRAEPADPELCSIEYVYLPHAQVWENLTAVATKFPVVGNKGGSYLTMFSKGGFIFGIINIIGNFGTVFVDQVGSPKTRFNG